MPDDIIKLLIALLSGNWNNSNTSSVTPEFGVGNEEEGGSYRVLISNVPNEDATGTSGVAGIGPGGSAVQIMRGLVFVNCSVVIDGAHDPDELSDQFAREIQRIVVANINNVAGYDYVSFLGFNRVPPQNDNNPFRIQRSCRIGYQWRYVA